MAEPLVLHGGPLTAPRTTPASWCSVWGLWGVVDGGTVGYCVAVECRGLAQDVRVKAYPLKHVLRHTQHGVNRLYLLVSEEREASHSEQSVEWIHLQRRVKEGMRKGEKEWCQRGDGEKDSQKQGKGKNEEKGRVQYL